MTDLTKLTTVSEEDFDTIVRDGEYAIRRAIESAGAKLDGAAAEKLGEVLNDFLVEHVCYVAD